MVFLGISRFGPKIGAAARVVFIGTLVVPLFPPCMPLRFPGQTYSSVIRHGEAHAFDILMRTGACARIEVDQRDIDLAIDVFQPNGEPLIRMNGSEWGREVVSILAERGGIYRLYVLAALSEGAAGSYQIGLSDLRSATDADLAVAESQSLFASAVSSLKTGTRESLTQAITLFRRAAETAHRGADPTREGQALGQMGIAGARMGDYEEALAALQDARRIWTELKDDAALVDVLRHIRNLSGHLSTRFDVPSDEELLAMWRRIGDRRGTALALHEIGARAEKLGDIKKASIYQRKALDLRRQIGMPSAIAASLEDLARLELKRGKPAEARPYAAEALEINRSHANERGEASCLYLLGDIERGSGQVDAALQDYEQSRFLRHRQGDGSAESHIFDAMANVELKRGHYQAAIEDADQALAIDRILDAKIHSPQLRAGFIGNRTPALIKVAALMRLHDRLPRGGYGLEALVTADDSLERHLRNESGPSIRASDLAQAVPDEDTTILEYWISELGSVGWAVTRNGITAFALPPESVVVSLAGRVLSSLIGREKRSEIADRPEAEFTRIMLAPIKGKLRRRVLIAGNGPIQALPFAALPDPEDSEVPLLAHHEIGYFPSIAWVLSMRRRRSPGAPSRGVAIFADPIFDGRDARLLHPGSFKPAPPLLASAVRAVGMRSENSALWRLPFAQQEADRIAECALRLQCSVYSGIEANRERFIQVGRQNYRIIHVITHALDNNEDPNLSGLILSLVGPAGQPREGFFRLNDIYRSQMTAELLVLSACQTATGKKLRSEGLLGLTSGFLYAGAGRVLSTAWKVDDEATSEFMYAFYRELPLRSPGAALRAAQLKMLGSPRWQSRYYWAGFLLHGDWSWRW